MKYIAMCMMALCSFHHCNGQLNQVEARALLYRVLGKEAGLFGVEEISSAKGKDVFELASKDGLIILRGNNGIAIASALNFYLKQYCHCSITWNGSNLKLPKPLPLIYKQEHHSTPYTYRYYLNYCTFNYSMSWWNWERWEKEIDWMALNGISMPLALTGEEAIWKTVYNKMGFTDTDLKPFFTGPAYFAWFWMGNIDGWGGPLPQSWMKRQLLLQKRILKRERALGMTPVLPAFSGHVPPDFKKKFSKADLKKTGWAKEFDSVYILGPEDSLFGKIGSLFLKEQQKQYGTDHLYSADTFNENIPPSSDSGYLDRMAKSIFRPMFDMDTAAKWIMQGWMFHYNNSYWHQQQIQALVNAVPDGHLVILDLYSESFPVWKNTNAYYGKPWIWNMLQNFGANSALVGRMQEVARDPAEAYRSVASGNLVGIGLTPEGIEQNPALFDLMLENVWSDTAIDIHNWLKGYIQYRYRMNNPEIDSAWSILVQTVYKGGLSNGGPASIIQARPTLDSIPGDINALISYDPKKLAVAWKLIVGQADILALTEGGCYDLVDLTRQVLANYATDLQRKVAFSYKMKNEIEFKKNSQLFLELIDDIDRLLGTNKWFLLGKWLSDARRCGQNESEKKLYEKNARDLITLWGGKNSALREYANKQWNGLLSSYYKKRWQLFFNYLNTTKGGDTSVLFNQYQTSVADFEWSWVNNSNHHYISSPDTNTIPVIKELYLKYKSYLE